MTAAGDLKSTKREASASKHIFGKKEIGIVFTLAQREMKTSIRFTLQVGRMDPSSMMRLRNTPLINELA